MARPYRKKIDYSWHNYDTTYRRTRAPKDPKKLSVWRTWQRFWYTVDGGHRGAAFRGDFRLCHSSWWIFEKFYEDVGPRPKGHRLCRPNKKEAFGPRNFEWVPNGRSAVSEEARKRAYEISIRILSGHRTIDIAKEFGVSNSIVSHIVRGRTYRQEWARAEKVFDEFL